MSTIPTLGEWLESRREFVPNELRNRVDEMLGDALERPVDIERMSEIATQYLGSLVKHGITSRAVALDLLAIDAIVTYALEASATLGLDVSERASEIMRSISRLMEPEELEQV